MLLNDSIRGGNFRTTGNFCAQSYNQPAMGGCRVSFVSVATPSTIQLSKFLMTRTPPFLAFNGENICFDSCSQVKRKQPPRYEEILEQFWK